MTQEEQIRAALTYVDSNDRTTWVKMGAAIKTEIGESGFNIWDEWSQTSDKYNPKSAKTAWKSLKEGRVNIGTLFYEAKQRGYVPAKTPERLSREEIARRQQENAVRRLEQERQEKALKEKAQQQAKERWNNANPSVDLNHPYLVSKGITSLEVVKGLRMEGDNLLIPLKKLGEIQGLQTITPEGEKRFNEHAMLGGSSFFIGDWTQAKRDKEIVLAEGFATGASIHLATSKAVVVCFTGNNLEKVAEKIAQQTGFHVVIAADKDRSGMGEKYAYAAQAKFEQSSNQAVVKLPDFTPEELNQQKPPSDFNDLATLRGNAYLKQSFDETFQTFEQQQAEQEVTQTVKQEHEGKEAQELSVETVEKELEQVSAQKQENVEEPSENTLNIQNEQINDPDNERKLESEALAILAQSSRPTRAQIEVSQEADTDVDAKFGQISSIGTIPSEAIIQAQDIRGLKNLKPAQQIIVRSSINLANKTMGKVDHSLRNDIKRNYVENLEKAINTNTLNIPKQLETFVEQKLNQQKEQQKERSVSEKVIDLTM